MKNLFNNIVKLFALSMVLVLASCGDDEDPATFNAPTLSITPENPTGSTYSVGADVNISFDFTAEAEISSFNYFLVLNEGLSDEQTSNTIFVNPADLNLASNTAGTFSIAFPVDAAQEGKTVTMNFQVVDKQLPDAGLATATYGYTVNVEIETFTQKLFGAQGNSNPGFYNAVDDQLLSYAEARDASGVNSSTVDFAYYWGANDNSTLAAIDDVDLDAVYTAVQLPIDGIFGTKNSTTFKALMTTPAEFDAVVSNAQLQTVASFETGGASSAKMLAADAVLAFKLDEDRGGKFGLIKVVSVDDTNGEGTITIDVKIEK